jgi:hypothetical protein
MPAAARPRGTGPLLALAVSRVSYLAIRVSYLAMWMTRSMPRRVWSRPSWVSMKQASTQ